MYNINNIIVPDDFDPKIYKELNGDLRHLTDLEATVHYSEVGHLEKRNYNLNYSVYVYCCGKSGSSTLKKTFAENGYNSLHCHNSETYNDIMSSTKLNPNVFDIIEQSMINNKHVTIIDSYRNPIERKISSFFENYRGHNVTARRDEVTGVQTYEYDDIIKQLDEQCYYLEQYDSINEVLDYFNLPRFTSFDFVKKYNIVQYKNVTIIKLRFEDINEWGNILSEIFGKPITIFNENMSDNKKYAYIYNIVKNNYTISLDMLEYIEHYYPEFRIYNDPESQEKYINYWTSRTHLMSREYLPIDFNWTVYNELNADLREIVDGQSVYFDEEKSKIHYIRHGYSEGRQYKIRLPEDFNWIMYNKLNEDLHNIINGEYVYINENQSKQHYIRHGYSEGRQYKIRLPEDFNWIIYNELNADLREIVDGQSVYLDEEKSKQHYLNHGFFECREYNEYFKNIIKQNNEIDLNSIKNLIIIACHTTTHLKYETLKNNIKYLNENTNYPIIIINSIGTENYNYLFDNVIKTIFIENNNYGDFGKWGYIIDNYTNLLTCENIIFTNDSYIITNNIDIFYRNIQNYDLFAYNDSSQCQYHYQSYLFSIKINKMFEFSMFIKKYKNVDNSNTDLVREYEFRIHSLFSKNTNCLLKIAYTNYIGRNIQFTNDTFYKQLLNKNLMPIIKIKRIYYKNDIPDFIKEYIKKLYLLNYI